MADKRVVSTVDYFALVDRLEYRFKNRFRILNPKPTYDNEEYITIVCPDHGERVITIKRLYDDPAERGGSICPLCTYDKAQEINKDKIIMRSLSVKGENEAGIYYEGHKEKAYENGEQNIALYNFLVKQKK